MDDIEELRRLLQEERRRREEEQRRREEAEIRAREAEELIQQQTLQQYLEGCHSLDLAIDVVTDPSSTTQGDTTNPTGRIFPRRIIPWADFATKQEEIWDLLSADSPFSSEPAFASRHQLEYVKSVLRPISCEIGLRNFERDVVENAVQKLVDEVYDDLLLRSNLGLQGTITFESHTNLGNTAGDPITEPMEHISNGIDNVGAAASAPASKPPATKAHRKARGKGNRADQFCIYRTSDSQNIPVLAIEYKAPHKLSVDEIAVGLESEIRPERDVINKHGQGFAFAARALAAAIVTQCFSYMVGKGLQYGYVCTGQAFIFLYIPDDPATVYCSICVPSLDVMEDDEARLHRTATSQVFAFILQALRADPPPMSWHDAAERLDIWPVEYDDVLKNIPASVRKEPRDSPYRPQRWKPFKRSPIMTRSRRSGCRQPDADAIFGRTDEDDEDPPSPTPTQPRGGAKAKPSIVTGSGGPTGGGRGGGRDQQQRDQRGKPKVQDRPFCTQRCLLGLANGGPTDKACPNSEHHGQTHIDRLEFLDLLRAQLAVDRGRNADCAPLHRSGRCGSLFKVRLTSHGYTLVAKGMEGIDRTRLQAENEIYDRLRSIQGTYVPVCLGCIDLRLPQYYDSGVYEHFMLLSWAGRPLLECINQVSKAGIINGIAIAFQAVHKLRILHRDAKPRNMLYDTNSKSVMLVDFERAEFRGRQPLGLISPNDQRKREASQKQREDDFMSELQSAMDSVIGCRLNHAVASRRK
jgi:hypothetical protein